MKYNVYQHFNIYGGITEHFGSENRCGHNLERKLVTQQFDLGRTIQDLEVRVGLEKEAVEYNILLSDDQKCAVNCMPKRKMNMNVLDYF